MKKILLIFGTRPEAIKMCPLFLELKKREGLLPIVCITAQHRQMLDQVLDVFGITPDYDLDIMKSRQDLFDITSNVLIRIKKILETERPNLVLVHGDTSTAFAAALASFYLQIPIGHIEAGLRTYDVYNPYPEEFNRQSVDIMSSYFFAPTNISYSNLLKEGKSKERIFVTGNTVIDSMKYTVNDDFTHPILEWIGSNKMIFITAHRRENLGEPMRNMFRAVKRVINEFSECKAIYPIHMNPVIREIAEEELCDCEDIKIIEPIDIIECHNFESRAYLCLTDSGGIQEECPHFGVPVLVMRNTTERPEGIDAGTSMLVGTDEEYIFSAVKTLLEDRDVYEKMSNACNPYGDGHASERIADVLEGKEFKPWSS